MTSAATGIGLCCALGLNMAALVVQQAPPPPTPKPPLQTSAKSTQAEITVTGCLVQGSAANVFILQNAKRDPQSPSEKGARYIVAPATEDLFLKEHLNHQVRILGVPDGRPQPTPQAGSPVDEKLIPALSAKGLTMVAPTCGAGGGGLWTDRATGGRAGERFTKGWTDGGYGGIAFAPTSPVTEEFSQDAPAEVAWESEFSEFREVLDWVPASAATPFDSRAERMPVLARATKPSHLVHAGPTRVSWTSTTEPLREDLPVAVTPVRRSRFDARILNPEPGTLLLIASGLLLVVYAGRGRDWNPFWRRWTR
jgi:hypothetical protein